MRQLLLAFTLLPLSVAAETAAPARAALEELLLQNRAALIEEFGAERLDDAEAARAAQISALSRRAEAARRGHGNRRILGPWAAYATTVARRLSVANGWPSQPVEISTRLEPSVGMIAGRLVISRAALALTATESELAAMLVFQLARQYAWNRDALQSKIGDRLAFQTWADDSWLDTPDRIREAGIDAVVAFSSRRLWLTEDQAGNRWDTEAQGFLEKAGYRGADIHVADQASRRWDELAAARGVTLPPFARPQPPLTLPADFERAPPDPRHLAQLEGLPMGRVEDAPLLVGNRLLLPRWQMKLLLPQGYGWASYGDGAAALEDDQEYITLIPFEAPRKTPLDKAAYFDIWPDPYRPSAYRLTGAGGVPVGLAVGYGGQGQVHSMAVGLAPARPEPELEGSAGALPAQYLHLATWGIAPESARRRHALSQALFTLKAPLDEQDRQALLPRRLSQRRFEDAGSAQTAWREMDRDEQLLSSILNDLPAPQEGQETSLPLHRALKLVQKTPPAGDSP
ncbi:hypothetical protein ACFSM5_05380 [Lacibacterium aquatile]|uniref:Uncharacterized protein n=1 Tax=Lacibacterium aquatile TaxID=1168082 RepID=A0ABW5DRY7_9PROT